MDFAHKKEALLALFSVIKEDGHLLWYALTIWAMHYSGIPALHKIGRLRFLFKPAAATFLNKE